MPLINQLIESGRGADLQLSLNGRNPHPGVAKPKALMQACEVTTLFIGLIPKKGPVAFDRAM